MRGKALDMLCHGFGNIIRQWMSRVYTAPQSVSWTSSWVTPATPLPFMTRSQGEARSGRSEGSCGSSASQVSAWPSRTRLVANVHVPSADMMTYLPIPNPSWLASKTGDCHSRIQEGAYARARTTPAETRIRHHTSQGATVSAARRIPSSCAGPRSAICKIGRSCCFKITW